MRRTRALSSVALIFVGMTHACLERRAPTDSTGSGGASGAIGSGGAGGVPTSSDACMGSTCVQASECPDSLNECVTRTCEHGCCESNPVALGTAVVTGQTNNDCRKVVCNGQGWIETIDDDDDVPADADGCHVGTCNGGVPAQSEKPVGSPCSTTGGSRCAAGGVCVECLESSDCGAPRPVCDTESGAFRCVQCLQDFDCTDTAAPHCDRTIGNDACVASLCANGIQDAGETDTDCGGPACGACPDGKKCSSDTDCVSKSCQAHICAPANCTDSVKNGSETDVDCGGAACVSAGRKCALGRGCITYSDCLSGLCVNSVCTGKPYGAGCLSDGECSSAFCVEGVCCDSPCSGTCQACNLGSSPGVCGNVAAGQQDSGCAGGTVACNGLGACMDRCADGVKDGAEPDIDCGGSCAVKCGNGKACFSDTDCSTGFCHPTGHACAMPSCSDGARNGGETDVDCGGPCVAKCGPGKSCFADGDCASAHCYVAGGGAGSATCHADLCSDGAQDGGESDIDCGGSCGAKCAVGQSCLAAVDCASAWCSRYTNTCVATHCQDGWLDGDESDIDCGGAACPKCASCHNCAVSLDCTSGSCNGGRCGCGPLQECFGVLGLCLPARVSMPGGYSIDSTEVTLTQYRAWLATNPVVPPSSPNSVCAWKTSYHPGGNSADRPVSFVDWCDAYAFCAGVGKRLCGGVGGGASAFAGYTNASGSQWYRACSAGGTALFPYGNSYLPNACNGADHGAVAVAVGSMASCQSSASAYSSVFDLSGNVAEWEDSCNGTVGSGDLCRLRGGAYNAFGSSIACATNDFASRDSANNYVGFRCCY
jgi:hypothetical protein